MTIALALMCGLVETARAQRGSPPAERFPAALDRYVQEAVTRWKIPGLAIGVVRNDSTLVAKGYGVRRLGRPEPADENTVFDIASLSKSFTATAAAILVDRGVLRWDDPVRRFLPDLVLSTDSLTTNATVRDFLSHRTGLDAANMMWVPTAVDRAEVLRRMRYLRPVAPFRQTMTYSNIGYSVAGEAMAAAAHLPFETLLRNLIMPLEMPSTTWTYDQAAAMPNLASPHVSIGGVVQPIARELQRQSIAPAAAVQSSVTDLTRWMRLHLNNGVLDGKRYVSDSAMRAMHSLQVKIPATLATPAARAARLVQDTVIGYGMGWQITDYRGHPVVWHSGNGDGVIAWMALFPQEKLGIVVVVNTWSAPNLHMALINRIADTYLGYPPRDWVAEILARVPAADSARAAAERAMIAMRSPAPPPLPLSAYAGRYEHPLFGPIWIRREAAGLTLQMGEGRIADLEYHGANAFYLAWRDPFFREYHGTHLVFAEAGDSVFSFSTTLNRDQFTARKGGGTTPPAPASSPPVAAESILGKWNLRQLGAPDIASSWLEVERSGFTALVGRFVGVIGGARPIANIEWKNGVARFAIPTEWELPSGELRFEIRPIGDSVAGTMVFPSGGMRTLAGRRAPLLQRTAPMAWTDPVALFNGKDLNGWVVAPTARSLPNFWVVRDGVLTNTGNEGANLMTVQRYQDLKLHAEFRLPPRGTAGVFPRGRYWVMLHDKPNPEPFRGTTGAVHRFLIPNEDAALGPNVWQSIDITLIGRRVTIVVNGKPVIVDQIIPGPTGSAIDTDESAPGPIMLQGEETRVEFRNITIRVPRD